jgi:hypothetical protein
MNQYDEINDLGYASSAPDLIPIDEPHPKDEAEISTLEEVLALIYNRKQYFQSVDSLSLENKNFNVDQQLAINKQVLFHIQELESKITSVIRKVRAKQSGR